MADDGAGVADLWLRLLDDTQDPPGTPGLPEERG